MTKDRFKSMVHAWSIQNLDSSSWAHMHEEVEEVRKFDPTFADLLKQRLRVESEIVKYAKLKSES